MDDYKKYAPYPTDEEIQRRQQLLRGTYSQREGFGAIAAVYFGIIGLALGLCIMPVSRAMCGKPAPAPIAIANQVGCQLCHYGPSIKNLREYKKRHQHADLDALIVIPSLAGLR